MESTFDNENPSLDSDTGTSDVDYGRYNEEEKALLKTNAQLRKQNEDLETKIRALENQTKQGIAQAVAAVIGRSVAAEVPDESRSQPTRLLENRLGVLLKNYPNTWI